MARNFENPQLAAASPGPPLPPDRPASDLNTPARVPQKRALRWPRCSPGRRSTAWATGRGSPAAAQSQFSVNVQGSERPR